MPELPEIEAYLAALRPWLVGETLEKVRVRGVALLRTVDPPLAAVEGSTVRSLGRLGKRIVVDLASDLHLVLHLMLAGRLRRRPPGAPIPGRNGLAAFDFPSGTLLLTEAGARRRATLHVVRGAAGVAALDPGGIEVAAVDTPTFTAALRSARHTLKRALTDPSIVAGIGGAYADEILFRARLSPTQRTVNLDDDEIARLHHAAVATLEEWTARRIEETDEGDLPRMSAFHPAMAVHGRHGEPCLACGTAIRRIVARGRETNYCPQCQTGGRILADRALSRILRDDYPRRLDGE